MPSVIVAGDPMPMPRPRFRAMEAKGWQAQPNAHALRAAGWRWRPFVGGAYTPKEATARKNAIVGTWQQAGHGKFDAGVYVVLWAVFYFPRPQAHLGVAGEPTPRWKRVRPASRGASRGGRRYGGDVDNCLKLVMDALSGVAYHDDAQIVRLEGEKRYVDQGQAPGVSQTVIGIDPVTAPTPESETDPGGSVPAAAGVAAGIRSAGKPT